LAPIGGADIRILVALEDDYRAYRETIAAVLRVLRPHAEVKSTTLEALEDELERLDPQVVICGAYEGVDPEYRRPAWIELSLDPTQPTKISVGGRYLERTDPSVEELLDVIDEVVIDEVRVTHRNKLC
jgi:hypothetical protein